MAELKLVKMIDFGNAKFVLYQQDGRLGADLTLEEGEPEPLDVQILFDYAIDSLRETLDEMMYAGTLNAKLNGRVLVFSVKQPEEPVELLSQLGISHEPDQQLATKEAETAVAQKQASYAQKLEKQEALALAALQHGGQYSLTIKRPKYVLDKRNQLQTVDGGSVSATFKPKEVIQQELALVTSEEKTKANLEVQAEEQKAAIVKSEHRAKAQAALAVDQARYEANYQKSETQAASELQSQQLTNRRALEALNAALQKESTERKVEVETEVSRLQAAVDIQKSEYEQLKTQIQIEVKSKVSEVRRNTEAAEQQARLEASRYQSLLNNEQKLTKQEITAIEQEKQDRARRKAEAELAARQQAETLRRKQEELQREAERRERDRLVAMQEQQRRYEQALYEQQERLRQAEMQIRQERQQAQERAARLQAQYEADIHAVRQRVYVIRQQTQVYRQDSWCPLF